MNLISGKKRLIKFFFYVFAITPILSANVIPEFQDTCLNGSEVASQKAVGEFELTAKQQASLDAAVNALQVLMVNIPGHENSKKIFKIAEKIVAEIFEIKNQSFENTVKVQIMSSKLRNSFFHLGCLLALHPDKKRFEAHFYTAMDLVAETFAWPDWIGDKKALLQKMRWLRLKEMKRKAFSLIKEVFLPPAAVLGFIVGVDRGEAVLRERSGRFLLYLKKKTKEADEKPNFNINNNLDGVQQNVSKF